MEKMKVLIPLLSKQENNEDFLDKATAGAKQAILLLVVDTQAMHGQFGFAATEIRQGSMLLEQVKEILGEKRKPYKDIIEWGDTATKIEHIAKLNKADRVIMQKQNNKFFNDLVKNLKKQELEIETI